MDTWTLGEKYKAQQEELRQLKARVKYMEQYLATLTRGNKKDEKLQDKQSGSSRVRATRRNTKKS